MRLLSILCAFLLTLSTFNAASQPNCDNNEVILTLETGAWASEIDFAVFDSNMDSLFVFSALGFNLQDNTVYTTILCLDDGCYNVVMYDSFGDGWNGAELTISYGDTMIPLGGLEGGDIGQLGFGINAEGCITIIPGCTDPEALNYNSWANEDDGSCEYPFTCETGTPAQMYVCTFANGTEVNIDVIDDQGNVVFSVENQTSPIVYYELCLEDSVCYTIEMSNSAGNNGWYGGYFWVNVGGVQIVNDELDPNSSFGVTYMSLDGSCPEYGCTDSTALNYDIDANEDDGSCEYPEDCDANTIVANTFGGTFPGEIQWYLEDGNGSIVLQGPGFFDDTISSQVYACIADGCYVLTMIDTFGDGWNGAYVTFSIDGVEIATGSFDFGDSSFLTIAVNSECDDLVGGCTDPNALNYNADADFDNGSCEYPIYGCTDPDALNYSPWANTDDGSCEYPIVCDEGVLSQVYVCTFSNGENVSLQIVDENGNVAFEANDLNSGQIAYFEACLDPEMCYTVYMSNTGDETGWYGGYYWVNVDGVQVSEDELDFDLSEETTNFSINGNCPTPGCTDQEALNYNPNANEDDGSCEYAEDCDANVVVANLTTGYWGEEVSWELLDVNQNVVWSGSGYASNQVYTDYMCLEDGCYTLVMNDSFGDGWNGGAIEFAINGNIELTASLQMGSTDATTLGLNSEGCVDIVYGCTNQDALNYNPEAVYDDGSCQYPILGCTDQTALNFNPQATEDDGSCVYPVECEEGSVLAQLYVCTFGNGGEVALELVDENGNVVFEVDNLNNGQIAYFDLCLDPNMCYTVNMTNTAGNGGWSGGYYWINVGGVQISTDSLDDDAVNETVTFSINGACIDEVVNGCTDPEALNYNPNATDDDGSCFYPEPCDGNNVLFTMQTGSWGNEISWQILNSDSTVVASGGNYPSNDVIIQDICLEDGCYTMQMFDSFGDGWNGAVIVLVIDNETAISFLLDSGSYDTVDFGVNSDCGETADIFGCTDPEALNYNWLATIDDGSCIYPGPYLGPSYALSGEDVNIEFNFAPNPVESVMLLTFNKLNPTQRLTVDIYDAVGRLVMAHDFGKTQEFFNTNINLESLESGAYVIVATNGASRVTQRLIKQ